MDDPGQPAVSLPSKTPRAVATGSCISVEGIQQRPDLLTIRREIECPARHHARQLDFPRTARQVEAAGYDGLLFPVVTLRRAVKVLRDPRRGLREHDEVDAGRLR